VPLDIVIRETSDAGTPITVSAPDSPYAQAFRHMAARIWDKVAGEASVRRTPPRIVVE
jgi:ATP-binding protein involved in chromosome partitioning